MELLHHVVVMGMFPARPVSKACVKTCQYDWLTEVRWFSVEHQDHKRAPTWITMSSGSYWLIFVCEKHCLFCIMLEIVTWQKDSFGVLVFKPGTTRLNCVWSIISSKAHSVSSWGIRLPSLRALPLRDGAGHLCTAWLGFCVCRVFDHGDWRLSWRRRSLRQVLSLCPQKVTVLKLEAGSVISSDQNEDLLLAASVRLILRWRSYTVLTQISRE